MVRAVGDTTLEVSESWEFNNHLADAGDGYTVETQTVEMEDVRQA